jgi:hypothetical protein
MTFMTGLQFRSSADHGPTLESFKVRASLEVAPSRRTGTEAQATRVTRCAPGLLLRDRNTYTSSLVPHACRGALAARVAPFSRTRPYVRLATRTIRGADEEGATMEALTTRLRSADRARTASHADGGSGLGAVQSFVEIAELRRLLARLATVELLQLLVSETFG